MSLSDCVKCWMTPCQCGWENRQENRLIEGSDINRSAEHLATMFSYWDADDAIIVLQKAISILNQKSQKKFQITCDARIDENHLSYISFVKDQNRKGIVAHTIEAEEMRIMIDIGHNGEVVGIEILGKERVPSILKEHLDK